jgi:hypothetical protein
VDSGLSSWCPMNQEELRDPAGDKSSPNLGDSEADGEDPASAGGLFAR